MVTCLQTSKERYISHNSEVYQKTDVERSVTCGRGWFLKVKMYIGAVPIVNDRAL